MHRGNEKCTKIMIGKLNYNLPDYGEVKIIFKVHSYHPASIVSYT
jgi:hypothetical protein